MQNVRIGEPRVKWSKGCESDIYCVGIETLFVKPSFILSQTGFELRRNSDKRIMF